MGKDCTQYVRSILFALIGKISGLSILRQENLFSCFGRVLIQDSTHITLPPHLADKFPGSKNQHKKKSACLKIQTVYDLLSDTFAHFDLSGFTRTDQAAAFDILSVAQPGDLVLRDLGYSTSVAFQCMLDLGIHFISRLWMRFNLYDPETSKQIDLVKELRKCPTLDRQILIGQKQQVPVRLVALPVPEDVANQRRRKMKNNRDKRCKPTKSQLTLLGWELFITSVSDQVWDAATIAKIYAMRWRIEIIFKSWKSHLNITDVPNSCASHVESLIWAQLIAISLFQVTFGMLDVYTFAEHSVRLSLLKTAPLLPILLTSSVISCVGPDLMISTLVRHFRLERRKKPHLSKVDESLQNLLLLS